MRSLTVGALAVVIALAGCGGDDPVTKAEYEEQASAIYAELATSLRLPLDTRAQREAAAPQVAGAMRDAADETAGIEPPEEIAEPHDAYVAALRRCADSFEDVLPKHDDKDEAFAELLALPCVTQMQDALGAMEDKGYRVDDPLG
jgi:hypothetical protein